MELQTLHLLIETGVITEVTIYIHQGRFEVWAYGEGYKGNNCLKTQRKEVRTFATADAALAVVLSCGFAGKITIDRPFV